MGLLQASVGALLCTVPPPPRLFSSVPHPRAPGGALHAHVGRRLEAGGEPEPTEEATEPSAKSSPEVAVVQIESCRLVLPIESCRSTCCDGRCPSVGSSDTEAPETAESGGREPQLPGGLQPLACVASGGRARGESAPGTRGPGGGGGGGGGDSGGVSATVEPGEGALRPRSSKPRAAMSEPTSSCSAWLKVASSGEDNWASSEAARGGSGAGMVGRRRSARAAAQSCTASARKRWKVPSWSQICARLACCRRWCACGHMARVGVRVRVGVGVRVRAKAKVRVRVRVRARVRGQG